MKKLLCALLTAVLTFALAGTALASDGADFAIDLSSDDWEVIMFGVNEEQYAAAHGTTYDEVHNYLLNTNTFIDAVSTDMKSEITVRKEPSADEAGTYLLEPKSKLSFAAGQEYAGIMAAARSCEYVGVYRHPQADFLVFDVEYYMTPGDEESLFYGKRYFTVINGTEFRIELFDYDSPIDEAEAERFEQIVRTLKFDSALSLITIGICAGAVLPIIVVGIVSLIVNNKKKKKAARLAASAAGGEDA